MRAIHSMLQVGFFRTAEGREPVREWLKALPAGDRKIIGDQIRLVQVGWPVGMPLVRKLEAGLWEIRLTLNARRARILFSVCSGMCVLLHGFIKKSQKLPSTALNLARQGRSLLEKES